MQRVDASSPSYGVPDRFERSNRIVANAAANRSISACESSSKLLRTMIPRVLGRTRLLRVAVSEGCPLARVPACFDLAGVRDSCMGLIVVLPNRYSGFHPPLVRIGPRTAVAPHGLEVSVDLSHSDIRRPPKGRRQDITVPGGHASRFVRIPPTSDRPHHAVDDLRGIRRQ